MLIWVKIIFEDILSCGATDTPVLGLLVMSAWFETQDGFITCMFHRFSQVDSSESPFMRQLLIS